MKLTTYFRKYFLSDLVILAVFAVLIYLPGKVFATEYLPAPDHAMSAGEFQAPSRQGFLLPRISDLSTGG